MAKNPKFLEDLFHDTLKDSITQKTKYSKPYQKWLRLRNRKN